MYLFSECRDILEKFGFDIEPQGTDTVVVKGVPEGYSTEPDSVEKLIPDLILALSDDHVSARENMISVLAGRFGDVAETMPVLYGGSCKPSNAKELFACADIDGGLIGGASLNADDFLAIAKSF